MQLRIKYTNFEGTGEVRDYLNKKLEQFEHFLDSKDDSVSWDVELERIAKGQQTGKIFRAEFNLTVSGQMLRAEATGESMLAAIDEAKDELKREYTKSNALHRRMARRGGRMVKDFLRGWGR